MSVPFKYRQRIRDIHESLHNGRPISWEELTHIMNFMCPTEHQALIEQYQEKCPLSSNDFIALTYELQKATNISYDEFVWNYIRGSLKNGVFGGEDRADVKILRSALDPLMRAVRLDVQNLYKEHATPDDEGYITLDQLCNVFQAMYPPNQIDYLELCKWAQAKKVTKGRGVTTGRGKTLGNNETSINTSITSVALTEVSLKPQTTDRETSGTVKEVIATSPGNSTNETTDTQQKISIVQSEKVIEELHDASKLAFELHTEAQGLSEEEKVADQLKTNESSGEVKGPQDDVGSLGVSEVLLKVTEIDSTTQVEKVNKTLAEKQQQSASEPLTLTVFEKEGKISAGLPEVKSPTVPLVSYEEQEPLPLKEKEVPVVLSSTSALYSVTPPDVHVGRRFGLDFNPSRIPEMEVPDQKNNTSDGKRRSLPTVKLRGYEEQPSWEYEEALLDAMLDRVVPGRPVDPQVLKYIRELTKQEKELEEALSIEMENLTSNMLATEVIEQRMMILRDQRRAQCFDRLETQRSELFAKMEAYVSKVRTKSEKNKVLLGGKRIGVEKSIGKESAAINIDSDAQSPQRSTNPVSMFTPPSSLSVERRKRSVQRERRLGEYLQSLQRSSSPATCIPKDSQSHTQQTSSAAAELAGWIRAGYTSSQTPKRSGRSGVEKLKEPTPIVQHRTASGSRHLLYGEDMTLSSNLGFQTLQSPLPRQPVDRGVNPQLRTKITADLLTSSQVQHQIQERLAEHFSKKKH